MDRSSKLTYIPTRIGRVVVASAYIQDRRDKGVVRGSRGGREGVARVLDLGSSVPRAALARAINLRLIEESKNNRIFEGTS